MQVNGSSYSTLWYESNTNQVVIIDQTLLPHQFKTIRLQSLNDFCFAIAHMQVRGAPLIGITAAFGLALALTENASVENEEHAAQALLATRPTAVNLQWAITRIRQVIAEVPFEKRAEIAIQQAINIRDEDIISCNNIGEYGLTLLQNLYDNKKSVTEPLNILTHCNAGWLATIDWGTALAPIYKAQKAGMPIHVWVDETRPRNQGASLTAWELNQQGINHTVIADNTGGHLMQHGLVDLCLVGSDRTTATGDVCNKIGTYLKALAAADNNIDFYVALPASTIDWTIRDGLTEIEIEQRDSKELTTIQGMDQHGQLSQVKLVADSPAANYAFDVTPARLVTGLITEHGIYQANTTNLQLLKEKLQTQVHTHAE